MPRLTRAQIKALKPQIERLHLQGYSYRQMQEKLNVNKDTACRLMREIREDWAMDDNNSGLTQRREKLQELRLLKQQMWQVIESAERDIDKIKAAGVVSRLVEIESKLYALDKATESVSVNLDQDFEQALESAQMGLQTLLLQSIAIASTQLSKGSLIDLKILAQIYQIYRDINAVPNVVNINQAIDTVIKEGYEVHEIG